MMENESSREKKRVFVVYNPVAGTDDDGAGRKLMEVELGNAGWDVEFYETTGEEVVSEIVQAAVEKKVDMVIAAGGDGTVAGVATGLVGTDTPLGIVAQGSGNVFAQELGIPIVVDEALELLTGEHRLRKIDAMRTGKNYYFLTLSVGLSTKIMQDTKREQKRRFGFFAYVWNGLSKLSGIKLQFVRLTVDGRKMSSWASEVLVLNAGLMGVSKFRDELGITPDDGKVEVCVIRSNTMLDLMGILWNLLVVGERNHPELKCMNVHERIRIETSEPVTVEGDGEIIGKTPLDIEIVPSAIQVVVPTESLQEAEQESRERELAHL